MVITPKKAKKRATANNNGEEERVSLIGKLGQPAAPYNPKQPTHHHNPWPLSRLLRYLCLTFATAVFTFFALRREQKTLHWEQYHSLLEPDQSKEAKCYMEAVGSQRCTCPDPSMPMARSGLEGVPWRAHHEAMIYDAQHAPVNLDLVMVGDSIIERWNGTRALGTEEIDGMKDVFRTFFSRAGGGAFEGLALGSSGDTGPNLLWHLQNGVLDPLNPKVWLILIGSNDLFTSQCTDRFVVADILNVLRYIHEKRPEAQFIVHGLLPRSDPTKSKSTTAQIMLGRYWKRAQAINAQLKRFCEEHSNLHYMQAGKVFVTDTEFKGRVAIDKLMMGDGIHPTVAGLRKWGPPISEMVNQTILASKG